MASLVELVVSGAHDGLDIDYEHLALTTNLRQARRVRGAFTQFVTELCGALHALSRRCTITVMPRTGPRFTVWRAKLMPAVYDYAALSGPADEVRVMAYDQHAQSWGPRRAGTQWHVGGCARQLTIPVPTRGAAAPAALTSTTDRAAGTA